MLVGHYELAAEVYFEKMCNAIEKSDMNMWDAEIKRLEKEPREDVKKEVELKQTNPIVR